MGNPWRVTMNEELERLVQGAVGGGRTCPSSSSPTRTATRTQQISQIPLLRRSGGCDNHHDHRRLLDGAELGDQRCLRGRHPGRDHRRRRHDAERPQRHAQPEPLGPRHGRGHRRSPARKAATCSRSSGISGHPLVQQENAGFDQAMAEHEKPHGRAQGQRGMDGEHHQSPAVLQALAHHAPADRRPCGTTGSETRVIAEAFEQAGRSVVPLVTGSITGDRAGILEREPRHLPLLRWGGPRPTLPRRTRFGSACGCCRARSRWAGTPSSRPCRPSPRPTCRTGISPA